MEMFRAAILKSAAYRNIFSFENNWRWVPWLLAPNGLSRTKKKTKKREIYANRLAIMCQ